MQHGWGKFFSGQGLKWGGGLEPPHLLFSGTVDLGMWGKLVKSDAVGGGGGGHEAMLCVGVGGAPSSNRRLMCSNFAGLFCYLLGFWILPSCSAHLFGFLGHLMRKKVEWSEMCIA